MRFNFFKKHTPTWNDLSKEQQHTATRKMIHILKNLSGAKYQIVQGDNTLQRERPIVETHNEDYILTSSLRNRMLDLTRNAVRNSSTFSALLRQVDLNCIGTEGGKIIFNYDDMTNINNVRWNFYKYTRETDFYDNLPLNTLLKIILKTYLIGGDMVLVFDDGLLENSGKVCLFEPDEIMNTSEDAIIRHYGEGAHQRQGRVYNRFDRNIGVVISRACRGQETAPEEKCYFLKRNPDEDIMNQKWIMPRNVWRASMGRGITQASSVIGTLLDENDLVNFEIQAAKKNAQMFAQIINTSTTQDEVSVPSAFDNETDFSSMTDEQIEEAVKAEQCNQEQIVSMEAARSAGILYTQMPDNYKMELLDCNHPNTQTIDFVKWLCSRSAATFGMSQQYATLCATGSDYKAERLLTEPFFRESQKFCEGICDWIFCRWVNWASRKGQFDSSVLGDDYLRHISWSWPKSDALDENSYQQAIKLKLENMTSNYSEILGPDWREKLMQTAKEIKWLKEKGLPVPQYNMISGGEKTGVDSDIDLDTGMNLSEENQ